MFGAVSVAHAQFPLPAPTQPAQPTPADTRGARVKTALEAKGLTVHGTGVAHGPGFYRGESEVDVFWADVAATYAQPTSGSAHQAPEKMNWAKFSVCFVSVGDRIVGAVDAACSAMGDWPGCRSIGNGVGLAGAAAYCGIMAWG